jgi:hypothetical protein
MSLLEKAVSIRMEKYLDAVRAVLRSNGAGDEEVAGILDNLRLHALETASRHAENMSLEDAVNRTIAALEPPETYAAHDPRPAPAPGTSAARTSAPRWLGMASALTMLAALLVAAALSRERLFDTEPSGTIFVFGEMLALGTGIAAWPDVWAKAGALCSGLLLGFLAVVFLWVTFLKTA